MKKPISFLNRRSFIKKGIAGLAGATALPSALRSTGIKDSRPLGKKPDFIYRKLGKTGLEVPIVSMGVMNADNPNLVAAALDSGLLHLDTAHGYQKGRNEEMIGQVIKNRARDSFIIATKVGYPKNRKTGLYPPGTTPETFQKEFDISLKRLGLEFVDILYIHSLWVRETVFYDPVLKFLENAKKQGKTRFVGLTTHRNEHEIMKAAAESHFYEVVLTALNFRQKNQKELKEAIAQAAKAGIGIVAMKTQAGVFWDKERQQPINMRAALKWALLNENVHTSIPGFTAFDQMNTDISVMKDLTLTPQEKADLRLSEKKDPTGLYCQQCEACLSQCPAELDIPTLMRSYMYAYGYRNMALARQTLDSINLSRLPCKECEPCRINCSMGFDVRSKTVDIARIKDVPKEFLG